MEEHDDQKDADNLAVEMFAGAMKAKLTRQRRKGYGGWDDPQQCSVGDLRRSLEEHARKGDVVDIANFAMMVWYRTHIIDRWDKANLP